MLPALGAPAARARNATCNADKVDPGIGRTRLGQRIFECVRAEHHAAAPPHKQAGHMTAPDQFCSNSESSCQGGAVHTIGRPILL
jgi:hypothetical protein